MEDERLQAPTDFAIDHLREAESDPAAVKVADGTPPPAELPDRATGGGGGNSDQQCEALPTLPSGRNEVVPPPRPPPPAVVVVVGNKVRCILGKLL